MPQVTAECERSEPTPSAGMEPPGDLGRFRKVYNCASLVVSPSISQACSDGFGPFQAPARPVDFCFYFNQTLVRWNVVGIFAGMLESG